MGAGDLLDDMIPDDELAPIVAVGVEDCGDGRQCFVLTNPEDTSVQLLVDTETYLPVVFRGRALDEDLDTDIELRMEWNAEVAISAPADAQQVSPDEFALSLVSFLFMTQAIAQGPMPAPIVVTGPVVEMPVEAVISDERTALWLELGASPYGEALDDAGDLFHGDPGISPVRYDPTVDILTWGAGEIKLAEATARELFGPDGAFPCGSPDPVVACGADGVGPGTYLLIWSEMLDPIPLEDPAYVRSFWAVFQDGDPSNDWVALPQFANDVLDGSDTHYRLEATPDGWQLAPHLWATTGAHADDRRGHDPGGHHCLPGARVGTRQSRCPEPGRGQLQRSRRESVWRWRRLGPLAGRAAAADAARRGGVLRRPLGVSPDRRRRALWRGGTRTSRANRPSARASGGAVCRRGA